MTAPRPYILPAGTPLKVNVLTRDLVAAMLEKQRRMEAEQADSTAAAPPGGSEPAQPAAGSMAAGLPPGLQQPTSTGARSLEQQLWEAREGSEQDAAAAAARGIPGATPLGSQQPPPAMHSPQQQHDSMEVSSAAPSSPASPPPHVPREPAKPLPQAALHGAAEAVVIAAQLLVWLLTAESAGRLRELAWLALAVALPPALAVWGRRVLLALALAAATVALAAARQWRALGMLLAAVVVADAAAALSGWRQRQGQPRPAPW